MAKCLFVSIGCHQVTLDITIWDVQHGAAAYIRTPSGKTIVVDLGVGAAKSRTEFSPLLHLKERYGVQALDEVIITHPHRDHLDDIFNFDTVSPRVLRAPKHLSEEEIWAGNQQADKAIIEKYLEISRRYSHPVEPQNNPERPENNGGVELQIFVPTTSSKTNLNNHSLIAFLTFAESTILIPGDNEEPSWRELLQYDSFRQTLKKCDILLAPHHGRQAGYCADLFEYFKPRLTIVSDGPATETTAVSQYVAKAIGWTVHKRSGGQEERKVVTTRSDGVINVKFGHSGNGGRFIQVTAD